MNPWLLLPLSAISVARLLTALPPAPTTTAGELQRLAAAAAPPEPVDPASLRPPEAESAPTLIPDSAGVIDLAGELTADQRRADQAQPANPFRLRYHAPLLARTVAVTISGVIRTESGGQDCCVLNGQILRAGEAFAGLTLSSISDAHVRLAAGRYSLLLPVDDRPLNLRLPQ